ncbi:MAG: hypothetical protein DMG27_20080 [Acidobacteria bacterium]|nr:MAG: hypothetical protein DMG27_20080 [Acidobacteriota bacterium]
MNPFRIFRLSPHVLAILGLATSAFGVTSATITGRVTDPSGAVVPGTKITATNVDTNVSSSTLTNEVGLYVIPDLPPGRYRVVVQKQGFETIVKPDVVLHVADVIGLNFSIRWCALNSDGDDPARGRDWGPHDDQSALEWSQLRGPSRTAGRRGPQPVKHGLH